MLLRMITGMRAGLGVHMAAGSRFGRAPLPSATMPVAEPASELARTD